MKPDARFLRQPKSFWAHVRSVSEQVGYTDRKTKEIKVPSAAEVQMALGDLSLSSGHLIGSDGEPSHLGATLLSYFEHRATVLNVRVQSSLMNARSAANLFSQVRASLKSRLPIPMNKQKGKKRKPAYLTGMVNMLVDAHRSGCSCDLDPRQLTSVTRRGIPFRTFARRIDGAFPSVVNPVAVWEVKEYYHTTTFGSRVADGVYETLLDGMELEELRRSEGIHVRHYLMLDDHFTWWKCGRSYLCRIIDLLHMGYVDEALFGREVVERLPGLVKEWVTVCKRAREG